jgi:hypothetical protein
VRSFSRPADGHPRGGDRAAARFDEALLFHLADGAGHGARGAAVWEPCERALELAWGELKPGLPGLRALAARLNRSLHDAGASACLVAGTLDARGSLRFASLGWGTHALVVTDQGPWRPAQPVGACGLKLGWLAPRAWEAQERAFVIHEVPAVRRLVLISDGLLEDDHRDPEATWAHLGELCAGVAEAEPDAVLPWLLERDPGNGDDLTVVHVELARPG